MTAPNTTIPLTLSEAVRSEYRKGKVGYGALARRFSLSREAVRHIVRESNTGAAFKERSCERKAVYATLADAETALAALIADKGTPRETKCTVYTCGFCNGFHIGKAYNARS